MHNKKSDIFLLGDRYKCCILNLKVVIKVLEDITFFLNSHHVHDFLQ